MDFNNYRGPGLCLSYKACNAECPDDGLCCFDGCADTCLDSLELSQSQVQFPYILTEAGSTGRRRLTEKVTETAREEEGPDIYCETLTRSD